MSTFRIPDIARIERDGYLVLPPGWAASFEHRIASFAAHLVDAEIRYESGCEGKPGRRVPLRTLHSGWLR